MRVWYWRCRLNTQPPPPLPSPLHAPLQPSQLSDFVPQPWVGREPLPMSLHAGRLLRKSLLLMALGCALSVLALWWLDGQSPGAIPSAMLVGGLGLVALLSARASDRWLQTLFNLWALGSVLTIASAALATGWGLFTPGLVLPPMLVLGVCAALGPRQGALLAAVAAVCLLLLAWLAPPELAPGSERGSLIASGLTAGLPAYGHLLLLQLSATALAWLGGLLIHRNLRRQAEVARQRQERFRSLLALAADAYWELDADYRLRAVVEHQEPGRQLGREGGLGQVPWRLPRFVCEPELLDQLLADLDGRLPFRDLPLGWLSADGHERRFLVSGEPRFGERGEFTGYWGVARDVTEDTAARQALRATEARYLELFNRIPTPLVMHRGGRVLEANPAAHRLMETPELTLARGADLLAWFAPGESRERARKRMDELEGLDLGTALPVTDFRLQVGSRTLWVRATGVRIAAQAGPATLSIFVDDTERRQAEESVRRNEALLSHLVATSPELITLSEMKSGRYVMVNEAFEKLTGHSAAQAVGRTATELGVWRDDADRTAFLRAVRQQRSVQDLPLTGVHRDGRTLALRVSAARFQMDQREYLVVNGRDVTDRERLRLERGAILENASVGIAVTRNGAFVLANPQFEALYGWPSGQLAGQPCSTIWDDAAGDGGLGAFAEQTPQRGDVLEFERRMRRRDGSHFTARVRGRAVDPQQPLEGGTVWIVEDVTERREFEAALARARDEAEDASRAKSAFLANTSHELRTPLNAMMGLARLARDPALDSERRQLYLDQIGESAQALADIISDILDLSKIEAGRLQLQAAAFDLGGLLRDLQRTYAALAAARGLALDLQAAAQTDGLVWGDALRVRQILTNYLGNAIKFTPSGRVTLRALRPQGQGGEWLRLEVEDTGEGVPPAAQVRLFKPFTQADESTTRRYGGTGLGLSICRELATLMGGRVGLHSAPGQGSCFWAELPLPPVQPPAAAGAATGLPADVAQAPPDQPDAQLREQQEAEATSLRGRYVLIVEDNPVNMLIAVAMMESWGLQVAQATDGRQAIEAVQRAFDSGRPFDAVLMDVQMPLMGGHEATLALRRTQAGAHLPIIALTAAALVTERQAALDAGMNDFLTKPVDADRLRVTLARWVLPVVS